MQLLESLGIGTWGVVRVLNSMEHAVESVLDQKQKVIGEFKL